MMHPLFLPFQDMFKILLLLLFKYQRNLRTIESINCGLKLDIKMTYIVKFFMLGYQEGNKLISLVFSDTTLRGDSAVNVRIYSTAQNTKVYIQKMCAHPVHATIQVYSTMNTYVRR